MNEPENVKGTYRHYKGNEYQLLEVGIHTETGEKLVVYRALYEPYGVWVRPYGMFFETVVIEGKVVPRFEKVINNTPHIAL